MRWPEFLWRRLSCWRSGHRWAAKGSERFCFRCGARQIYTVLPHGRRDSGRWIDKHGDDT